MSRCSCSKLQQVTQKKRERVNCEAGGRTYILTGAWGAQELECAQQATEIYSLCSGMTCSGLCVYTHFVFRPQAIEKLAPLKSSMARTHNKHAPLLPAGPDAEH